MELDSRAATSLGELFHPDDLGHDIHQMMLGDPNAQDETVPFPKVIGRQTHCSPFGRGVFYHDGNRGLFGSWP